LRDRSRRIVVRLAGVYTNESALVAELERKLGGRVAYQEITEIDLIHGHMLVDVRLQPGEGVNEPPQPKPHHQAADGAPQAVGPEPVVHDEVTAPSLSGRNNDGAGLGA
jgi:hypothetical protein